MAELKPWVRFVVTAYLLVLVPLLALMIGWIVLSAPRTFATAYDSFWLQLDRMRALARARRGSASAPSGSPRSSMPLAAMSLSLSRTVRMALRRASRAGRAAACPAAPSP